MNQYNLKGIYEEIWDYLDIAVKDRKSGFHTFSLATISNGYPDNRTVVLRGCCKKTMKLSFHTNNFSNKIIDISADHNVSALFYDKEKKIQIRIVGIANINNDNSYCKEKWENMSNQSKECYFQNINPGKTVDNPDQIKKIMDILGRFFQKNQDINVIQFKELMNISRKYAIDLLEYFDNQRFTIRKENIRVPGKNY